MKCDVCKKEVAYPDFKCSAQPGNHVVPMKVYYHTGSGNIPDYRDRRKFAPYMFLRADREAISPGGEIVTVPALAVQFDDAQYRTSDPEEQYYLDRHKDVVTGDEGLAIWRKNQLTPAQHNEVMKAELESVSRAIKEQNDLLAKVKASTQAAAKAEDAKGGK